mmetsp:Transcript_5700/g.11516  ORF Transcript_5700/g.11516 Transcript_5700/m.11516 type:complete len:235 (-) Transcript_5700:208-912(-)
MPQPCDLPRPSRCTCLSLRICSRRGSLDLFTPALRFVWLYTHVCFLANWKTLRDPLHRDPLLLGLLAEARQLALVDQDLAHHLDLLHPEERRLVVGVLENALPILAAHHHPKPQRAVRARHHHQLVAVEAVTLPHQVLPAFRPRRRHLLPNQRHLGACGGVGVCLAEGGEVEEEGLAALVLVRLLEAAGLGELLEELVVDGEVDVGRHLVAAGGRLVRDKQVVGAGKSLDDATQ